MLGGKKMMGGEITIHGKKLMDGTRMSGGEKTIMPEEKIGKMKITYGAVIP